MRFCMVTTFYPPYNFGGDGIFVASLAQALVDRGHDVEVVHCEDAYRLRNRTLQAVDAEADESGIIVHRLHSRLGPLSPLITQQSGLPGLKKARLKSILSRDFDVVNFHNVSLVGGPGILDMSNAPVTLYTLHEHWLICPTHILWKDGKEACEDPHCLTCCLRSGIPPQFWRYTPLIKRSLRKVDLLLSPSEFTARRYRDAGISAPISVVPTFSNIATDSLEVREPPTRPTFLFVGRVTTTKGIHVLLKDFVELKDYDLNVVGDGDLRLTLEKEYAGCKNIRFFGGIPHTELPALYQQATAIILPSLAPEVFPLTIMEALACGTPAIVRDIGGSREAIDKTGAGFVYKSKESFYDAIHRLARDPQLRNNLGALGIEGYRSYYTRDHYVNRYLKVVKSIRHEKQLVDTGEFSVSQSV